jgi:photosystem II stability/assembly factor-like uncharacterized protein
VAVDPRDHRTVFLGNGSGGGIFKSTDAGRSWKPASHGLTNTDVRGLAWDTDSGTTYAAAWNTGAFATHTTGESWRRISHGIPEYTSLETIAVDQIDPALLYAGADGMGAFASSDRGRTWHHARGLAAGTSVLSLAPHPFTAGTVYAGTNTGVVRSEDGGRTWSAWGAGLPTRPVRAIMALPDRLGTLVAGVEGKGLFRTMLASGTWKRAGLDETIVTLSAGPGGAYPLYAGGPDGVFRLARPRAPWRHLAEGPCLDDVRALVASPSVPGTVFAGTIGDGMFMSIDAGHQWKPLNRGLVNRNIEALVVSRTGGNVLHAATHGAGVWEIPIV